MTTDQNHGGMPSTAGVFGAMLGAVIVGAPMVFFIWEWLNQLLSAQATLRGTLIALVWIVVFVIYLAWLGRILGRESEPAR